MLELRCLNYSSLMLRLQHASLCYDSEMRRISCAVLRLSACCLFAIHSSAETGANEDCLVVRSYKRRVSLRRLLCKCMVMPRHQNTAQNHNLLTPNKS